MGPPVLLIHGGLAEDMDAERFWMLPGVLAGLRACGFVVAAPDRDTAPASWSAAADAMAAELHGPTSVVAGSNGVSIGVRLALQHRPLVDRLVLLWPATCGDPTVDAAMPPEVSHLLTGQTLRGMTDEELARLDVPTAVMASDPANPLHAVGTVDRLVALIPRATRIDVGFPEAPRPEFGPVCDSFVACLSAYHR